MKLVNDNRRIIRVDLIFQKLYTFRKQARKPDEF